MGTLTNLNGITEPQIPAAIARDTEVASAIASHVSAVDPHPTYLTQPEGDGRYRQTATPLVDGDIPAAIARDAEVASAIAIHAASGDSHSRQWGAQKGHFHYDSLDFNDPNLPLGWIWIRAGGTITNSFVNSLPGSFGSQCFLLSLSFGPQSPDHRFQIAFPLVGSSIGCWTRTFVQGIWYSWMRV